MNYREHEEFKRTYDDEPQLPKPVVVHGVGAAGSDNPFLGVGNIIGSIEITGLGEPFDNPVIEVTDVTDGQAYTFLGWDCYWSRDIPDEMILNIANGSLVVESVRHYLELVELRETTDEIAEASWLAENQIDPESL